MVVFIIFMEAIFRVDLIEFDSVWRKEPIILSIDQVVLRQLRVLVVEARMVLEVVLEVEEVVRVQ